MIVYLRAVGNVECNWNSLWASIWSRATPHDGYILATILDCWFCHRDYLAPFVHLHNTNLWATWWRNSDLRSSRNNLQLVHSLHLQLCLHLDHPNVSASTAQEHGRSVACSWVVHFSFGPVLVIRDETEPWNTWRNGCIEHIFLASGIRRVCVHFRRVVPSLMERILQSCLLWSMASYKALSSLRCNALVNLVLLSSKY